MAWMLNTCPVAAGCTVPGVVAGEPVSLGGSPGRAGASPAGVVRIALAALAHRGIAVAGATAPAPSYP